MIASSDHDLSGRLIAEIDRCGPIRLSRFMSLALSDSKQGYYQTRDPFGAQGDFTTAPEISGLFGEMCGLFLAHMADIAGLDNPHIIELGPGRGSLMADMRHVWKRLAPSLACAPVHLVETSPHLRRLQTDHLPDAGLVFHNNLDQLPPTPLFGIANEFFDALPIDQAIWRGTDAASDGQRGPQGQWYHRLVGIVDGRLAFIEGPALTAADHDLWGLTPPAQPPAVKAGTGDGSIIEYCPLAASIATQLAHHIAAYGGACLIIDYGRDGQTGDSLQAVADHRPVDVFHQPGAADLSHWVDFSTIGQAVTAAGARLIGPVTQGAFLKEIGIIARAETAGLTADADGRRAIYAAVDRLVSAHHMGAAFKVALLVPAGNGAPPGFATTTITEGK